ncbi:exosome complex endonuclease 1 [Penicillium atrosanguineum]|uniref:exosome complex endonuclease 1 n=1 Tax=Penicillium atrosanguineum TaxID=1132637 RepID=UPI0023887B66|nr:exosome complex endonuclease 1 [Penicillium atrosanguineum]KAJ5289960.1 exosome complex endonuclease 1 [Penicillium atrosanguineum]
MEDAERSDAGREARDVWSVKGESVLELGAGATLPLAISAIVNASRVVATDHPSSPAFAGAIKFNMDYNLRNRSSNTQISIEPREWGVLDSNFALQNKGAFTRIIIADCYWMPE